MCLLLLLLNPLSGFRDCDILNDLRIYKHLMLFNLTFRVLQDLNSLISGCNPPIPTVVHTTKQFKVGTRWHQRLDLFVHLEGLDGGTADVGDDSIRDGLLDHEFVGFIEGLYTLEP